MQALQLTPVTEMKGYQAGLPGWKKSKLPIQAESAWLIKNLTTQTVILDVRDTQASSRSHTKGAVAIPVTDLQALTQQFIKKQIAPELAGASDLRAPIVVYADSQTSEAALLAYKELRDWG